MSVFFSYSFSARPTAQAAPAKPEPHRYEHSEFLLVLSSDWKQVPTAARDRLKFSATGLGANIAVSVDSREIPDAKTAAIAQENLSLQLQAIEQLAPGRVQLLHRNIKPHSGGVGLELSLAAEVPGEHVHVYLGYVTSRKVLNFMLVCRPGRQAAAALFNDIVPNFRPRLP